MIINFHLTQTIQTPTTSNAQKCNVDEIWPFTFIFSQGVFVSSIHFPHSSYISFPSSLRIFCLLNSQSKSPIQMSKILPFQIVNPTPRIYPRTVTWIPSKPVRIPSVSKRYNPISLEGLRPHLHSPSFSFSTRALDDLSSSMETRNENIGELSEMEEYEKISGQVWFFSLFPPLFFLFWSCSRCLFLFRFHTNLSWIQFNFQLLFCLLKELISNFFYQHCSSFFMN